jgi:hypothetical protein
MNERIRELYKQAGMEFHGSSGSSFDIRKYDPEKFAELLIKECIKATMQSILDNNIGDREDCIIVGSDVEDHFGME